MARTSRSESIKFDRAPPTFRPELLHSYSVVTPTQARNSTNGQTSFFSKIEDAAELVFELESTLYSEGLFGPRNHSFTSLVQTVLDLSAHSNTTQGVFLFLIFNVNYSKVVLFFESGSFVGFLHNHGLPLVHQFVGSDLLLYRLFTPSDISRRKSYLTERSQSISHLRAGNGESCGKKKNRSAQIFSNKISQMKKHLELFATLARSKPQLLPHIFLDVLRYNPRVDCADDRYVHNTGLSSELQRLLEEGLFNYRVNSTSSYPFSDNSQLENFDCQQVIPMKTQFDLLSCIPNYHWGQYPIKGSNKLSAKSTNVNMQQYLAYQPPRPGSDTDQPQYLPASVRNRFIYFVSNQLVEDTERLVNFMTNPDSITDDYHSHSQPDEPVPKKRKSSKRLVPITVEMLQRQIGKLAPTHNMCVHRGSVFEHFTAKVIELGVIKWRLHDKDLDVIAMNDYDCDGEMLPSAFVHTKRSVFDGQNVYECSCSTYSLIQCTILGSCSKGDDDDDALPVGTLCMHCRFMQEHVESVLKSVFENQGQSSDSKLDDCLRKATSTVNDGVVPLLTGPSSKYSVLPRTVSSCSLVNLTNDIFTCQLGECQAKLSNKKSSRKLMQLSDAAQICPHLEAMRAQQELWFVDRQLPHEDTLTVEPQNSEDVGIQVPQLKKQYFDAASGLWDFGGLSQHAPASQHSLELSVNVRKRQAIHELDPSYERNSKTGLLTGIILKPLLPEKCSCGLSTDSDAIWRLDFMTTLYTRHVPLHCQVLKAVCPSGKCVILYSGKKDNIHFWSKDTAMPDEIGWDFVSRVNGDHVSFSRFCADMTRVYKSINPISAPFCSTTTFVSWFFSWAARFKIDFRQHIDPWCSYTPQMLACDGTHIGVSIKHMLITPIEQPGNPERIVRPQHRRYQRVFLPYSQGIDDISVRNARKHMKYLCKRMLGKEVEDKLEEEIRQGNDNLLRVSPSDPRCQRLLSQFIVREYPNQLLQALANFLSLLCGDAALSTVIPLRFVDDLVLLLDAVGNGQLANSAFICGFCPELGKCFDVSDNDNFHDMKHFVQYLISAVQRIHVGDEPSPPSNPVQNTYNPEYGVAYYFTPHGNKLRTLPKYEVSGASKVHDDLPSEDEICCKKYPMVSRGGWSYVFLWFCPLHGHCYGFHLINGSEGRKDPFSSALVYMNSAPKEVFYDFACSLHEYCLNREPSFWKNTRFWHDVFHGFSHKCGKNFKSRRISQLRSIDTEICEQFNARIQCIKYTGTHLSQSHFVFFLQFFIGLWQQEKTDAFAKRLGIAIAGYQD